MSPITRETLAARIATLEADSNISIKEGFYLQTMRMLLSEMDKSAPHHNGMMQLSNELTDLKRNHAELQAVVDQRNGECDRLVNEKQKLEKQQDNLVMIVKMLASKVCKNHPESQLAHNAMAYLQREGLISAADCLRGESFGNSEQLDTAAAQFESLAGEPVSQPYKQPFEQWLSQQTGTIDVECGCVMTEVFFHWLRVAYETGNPPVTPDGWVMVPKEITPEMMRAIQIKSELGGYATANLSGAYDLFSEFWNVAVSEVTQQEVV